MKKIFFSLSINVFIAFLLYFGYSGLSLSKSNIKKLGLSDYQYFIVYPHLQKGFESIDKGDERRSIDEFKRALEVSPNNSYLIIYLVESYRSFGYEEEARVILEEKIKENPSDVYLKEYLYSMERDEVLISNLEDLNREKEKCLIKSTVECRVNISYVALKLGELDVVMDFLEDKYFKESEDGIKINKSLLERAIFLEKWNIVDRIFSKKIENEKSLSVEEYGQWAYALLEGGMGDRFVRLQDQGLFVDINYYINYGSYLLNRKRYKDLYYYLLKNDLKFLSADQERRWVFLLFEVADVFDYYKNLVFEYDAQYPENKRIIVDYILSYASINNDFYLNYDFYKKYSDVMSLEDFFQFYLRSGRYSEAIKIAKDIYEKDRGSLVALDAYSWRMQLLGDEAAALDALLIHYPFSGSDQLQRKLIGRLFMLSEKHLDHLTEDQKRALAQPLSQSELRQQQVQLSWIRNDCQRVINILGDHRSDYRSYAWSQLGECYRKKFPGLAAYAFEKAVELEATTYNNKTLAYQYVEVKDYRSALDIWKKISVDQLSNEDVKAAMLSAELAEDREMQGRFLKEQKIRGLDGEYSYWLSKAKYYIDESSENNLDYLNRSISIYPTGEALALRAKIYRENGELNKSYHDLQRAIEIEPDNYLYKSALGYVYWDKGKLLEAKKYQEISLKAMPNDMDLIRQLSFINERIDLPIEAQVYIKKVIDDIDYSAEIKPLTILQQQERFNFRRMHEDVARKWTIQANAQIGLNANSLGGVTPGVGLQPNNNYRSYGQVEAEYRIGKNKLIKDDLLSIYSRFFADSYMSNRVWPTKNPMAGVGLRWKPWRNHVVFGAIEHQMPVSDDGQSDTLVRLSGSFLNGEKYSDDWHPGGKGWIAQNLYFDVGHYLRRDEQVWVVDYRASWYQKLDEAQAIEPYFHVQYYGSRRSGTQSAYALGMGVRWHLWFGQTHYSAWPHKLSLGIESQRVIKAINSAEEKKNNLFFMFGLRW